MTAQDIRSRRRRVRSGVAVAAAVALFATACGGDATVDETADRQPSASTTTPAPTTDTGPAAPSSSAEAGTVVTTGDSEFGVMLFDEANQAIYLFDREAAGAPDCYDDCAADWPPVLTAGVPAAGGDVRADLLGTVDRADGSTQVTYAGHPLYYYAHEAPGQVLCHDVADYGGTWLVVTPEGTPAPT